MKRPMKWKPLKRIAKGMSAGLTLLEILIVIAIMAVVAAMAYPSFQRLAINNNLKTAARDLASDFAQMKGSAISGDAALGGSRMYRISLNVGGNSYQLQRCNNIGSPCGGWETIQTKNLANYSNDIVFGGETNTVNYNFQPRGTITPGGTIHLVNSLGSEARLTTLITGRTNVQFNLQ